jgi:hypothetical protein
MRRYTSSRMDDRDQFWRLMNTPAHWQAAARDLICGANLLKKDYYAKPHLGFGRSGRLAPYAALRQRHTSSRTLILLYAFAIENLLKAIIVGLGKDPIKENGRLKEEFATHDLRKLAVDAETNGLDEELLAQLSDFIFSGKYPAGRGDGEGFHAHSYFPDSVLVGIEKVLPVLEERLAEMPAKREKLPKTDLLSLCAGRKAGRGASLPVGDEGETVADVP